MIRDINLNLDKFKNRSYYYRLLHGYKQMKRKTNKNERNNIYILSTLSYFKMILKILRSKEKSIVFLSNFMLSFKN